MQHLINCDMHLTKCQASFKCCNDSNGFCKKFYFFVPRWSCQCTLEKKSDTLITVMILFEKESISMVIVSDNKHHNKRTVVPYLFTVFNYVKEMFRENIQSINIRTDMAHLVNFNRSLPLAALVITFLGCFFIIIKSWKGGFGCFGGTI